MYDFGVGYPKHWSVMWQHQTVENPCPCQNCSNWLPEEKNWKRVAAELLHPSCPTDDPLGRGTPLISDVTLFCQCLRLQTAHIRSRNGEHLALFWLLYILSAYLAVKLSDWLSWRNWKRTKNKCVQQFEVWRGVWITLLTVHLSHSAADCLIHDEF